MSPTQGLVLAGKNYPGAKICCSPWSDFLHILAYSHANYMASTMRQGHQDWSIRFKLIQDELNLTGTEICAESWSWQENDDFESLGKEMFKCWKYSTGHWSVASAVHKYFGAGMSKGENGIWYACIIGAD